MAETETPKQTEPVKTATDLQIEKLTARLDALESENKELKTANQGLWAQLHPVTDQPAQSIPSAGVQTPTAAQTPTDYDVVCKKLGIQTEE